jgi:amino acid permease
MSSSLLHERTSILTELTSSSEKESSYQHGDIGRVNCIDMDVTSDEEKSDEKTTTWETFIHLLKGYVGPGCLSLPWAVSQLGATNGCCAIFVMAYWSSYNCWTIVKLKRHIIQEREEIISVIGTPVRTKDTSIGYSFPVTPSALNISPKRLKRSVSANYPSIDILQTDDRDESDVRSAISRRSSTTVNTNITYPEVGEWAYGSTFQSYTSFCIATQQLAICTVFFSFLGENLLVVLRAISPSKILISHVTVITLCLPFIMMLSFIPSLKQLAPFMGFATLLLLTGFAVLAFMIIENWENKPTPDSTMHFRQVPLGLCAILYSFEGICLILPVESSMKEPKQFGNVFVGTMILVALILASVSVLSFLSFGEVTNGSITAFLLQNSEGNKHKMEWLHVANTVVSFSVLLTYPLQLFPSIEIIGPELAKRFKFFNPSGISFSSIPNEKDLAGFEPLPPLPEHDVAVTEALNSFEVNDHIYEIVDSDIFAGSVEAGSQSQNSLYDNLRRDEASDDASEVLSNVSSSNTHTDLLGDSKRLRAFLVIATYVAAILVPNVQALISLAGALAGSSVSLLIPPLLELKYIQSLENKLETATRNNLTTRNCSRRDSWFQKGKCYVLLLLGLAFCMVGTVASVIDIINIYLHPSQ